MYLQQYKYSRYDHFYIKHCKSICYHSKLENIVLIYIFATKFFQSHDHASFTSNLISNQSFYCLYFHIPSLICQNWTCFILQAVVLQLQSFNEIMQFLNKLLIFPQELITVCFNEIPNLENEHVKLTSNLFLSKFLQYNNHSSYTYCYNTIDKSVKQIILKV